MATSQSQIRKLDQGTQGQIRSSVNITSIQDVVLGLVKNSLDANATHINVDLDFSKGYCAVSDNGTGIPESEFAQDHLARLNYTSKYQDPVHTYGRYGRFLASLSSISILTIISHHENDTSATSATFKNGESIAKTCGLEYDQLPHFKNGTRVIVHNLFGQIPVRFKHLLRSAEDPAQAVKLFTSLKRSLVGLLLAVNFFGGLEVCAAKLRYSHRAQSHLYSSTSPPPSNLELVISAFSQAGFLDSTDVNDWRIVSARSQTLSVWAAIGVRPGPTKALQFISLHQNPLSLYYSKSLCNHINSLFEASSFGVALDHDYRPDDARYDVDLTSKPGRSAKKGVDRWPMFCIRISTDLAVHFDESTGVEADRLIASADTMLNALILEFLRSNNFSIQPPGRTTRQKIKHGGVSTASDTDICRYRTCSNFRFSNGHQIDVLKGLPFIESEESPPSQVQAKEPASHTRPADLNDTYVDWIQPRSHGVLKINTRTGIASPVTSFDSAFAQQTNPPTKVLSTKSLKELASTLRFYDLPVNFEEPIQSVVCGQTDAEIMPSSELKGDQCRLGCHERLHIAGSESVDIASLSITKQDLKTASVIGQVDAKYILASLSSNEEKSSTLVLIDQHAADERIKVESLFRNLCHGEPIKLASPLKFEVSHQEAKRFSSSQARFVRWNIEYTVVENQVRLSTLPHVISERCRLEPKILIELMRTEIWREDIPLHDYVSQAGRPQISSCPSGILNLLASRACRSAIMFNDELTVKECQMIVQRLAQCSLPFQCAHGRPSLTVLTRIRRISLDRTSELGITSFVDRWKTWNGSGS